MKRNAIIALIITLFVALPILKGRISTRDSLHRINAEIVSEKRINNSILASGVFEYKVSVDVKPEVMGQVIAVEIEEGETVRKGQVIIKLDPTKYIADIASKKAELQQQDITIKRQRLVLADIERELRKLNKLRDRKVLVQEDFARKKHEMELVKVDLERLIAIRDEYEAKLAFAEDLLSKTSVRAPIDGLITELSASLGEVVLPSNVSMTGSSLFTVVEPSSLLATVFVNQADGQKVSVGKEADVYTVANDEQRIQGKVAYIASVAKEQRGDGLSFRVDIEINKEDHFVRAGMSCRSEIQATSVKNTLAVPVQAVMRDGHEKMSKKFVYVSENNKVKRKDITAGISDDSYLQVLSGLDLGDVVLTGPYISLKRLGIGDAVNISLEPN